MSSPETTAIDCISEGWRLDSDERGRMQREFGVRVEDPFAESAQQSFTVVTKDIHARATDILAGADIAGMNRDEALASVRTRFGCEYKKLPEEFRRDPEILMEATVGSCGHELQYAPPDVLASLDAEFFCAILARDVSPWVVEKFASPEVRQDLRLIGALAQAEQSRKEHLEALLATSHRS